MVLKVKVAIEFTNELTDTPTWRTNCWCLPPSLLRDTLSSKVCRQGSTALELDGTRNTKIQTGSGRELRNTLHPVWWFILPQVLMILRGYLPALIYPGGQVYMESPSRVQLESYYNTIGQFPLYCSQFYAYSGSYKRGKVHAMSYPLLQNILCL